MQRTGAVFDLHYQTLESTLLVGVEIFSLEISFRTKLEVEPFLEGLTETLKLIQNRVVRLVINRK